MSDGDIAGKTDELLAQLQDVEKRLASNPADFEACTDKGVILAQIPEYGLPAATGAFREAVRLNPESWKANALLGRCEFHRNNYKLAKLYIEKSLTLEPDPAQIPAILLDLGRVCFHRDELAASRDVFLRVLSIEGLSPEDREEAIVDLLHLYQHLIGYELVTADEAKALLKEADAQCAELASSGFPSGKSKALYAEVLRVAGLNDEAMTVFTELIASEGAQADFYRGRAMVFSDMGRPQEALMNMEQAVELASEDYGLLLELVDFHVKVHGREGYLAAISYCNRAIGLKPGRGKGYWWRGYYRFQLGKDWYGSALEDLLFALKEYQKMEAAECCKLISQNILEIIREEPVSLPDWTSENTLKKMAEVTH